MSFSRRFPQLLQPEQAPPRFTLVEYVAIPFVLCVMETQPIVMVVALLTLLGGSTLVHAPLGMGEIFLLQLGLLWWAQALAFLHARGRLRSAHLLIALRLCSLLAAWLLLSLSHLANLLSGTQEAILVGECLLAFWLWLRSQAHVRLGFAYEPLATSFQVGLGVLLAIILLALVAPSVFALLPALEASLTIFFLSGLVTLSLARLGVLRQVSTVNGKQADPTRSWLGALLLFSCFLTALVFLLEAVFSYASFLELVRLLQPLWDVSGTLVGVLLSVLAFLIVTPLYALLSWVIGLLRGSGTTHPMIQLPASPFTPLANTQHPIRLSPELLQVGRWVVLGAVGLLVLALVRASLRRWFLPAEAAQLEETREQLDRHALAQLQHRSARGASKQLLLSSETLDSVRAYYRLLLHTVATARPELTRLLDETPLEYERRLSAYIGPARKTGEDERESASHHLEAPADPSDALILEMVTQMYMGERYGQQQFFPQQFSSLRQWVPRLLDTLTGKGRRARGGSHAEPEKKKGNSEEKTKGER